MMKLGGSAAVTACNLCIYLNIMRGNEHLYTFDINSLRKADYIKFAKIMKLYLRSRMSGINTLQLYIDGLGKYLYNVKDEGIKMITFSGENSVSCG